MQYNEENAEIWSIYYNVFQQSLAHFKLYNLLCLNQSVKFL